MKLSKRLQAIADLVPKNSIIGDIGTDHGQLPCYLVQQRICPRVIAADINALPLAGAEKRIRELGLEEQITTRLGNGLTVLKPGEVQGVTISGMGGSLMVDILEASKEVVGTLSYIILQPNLAANLIRQWVVEHNFIIDAEDLVFEDGRYYEVIALKPGERQELSLAELWTGPKLLEMRHTLLLPYLQKEWEAEQKVLKQLQNSQTPEAAAKHEQLLEKWQKINEVISCQFHVEIL